MLATFGQASANPIIYSSLFDLPIGRLFLCGDTGYTPASRLDAGGLGGGPLTAKNFSPSLSPPFAAFPSKNTSAIKMADAPKMSDVNKNEDDRYLIRALFSIFCTDRLDRDSIIISGFSLSLVF